MIKKLSTATLVLLLSLSTLYAGKGKIRVASDQQGAYVYVDGKKKAMTGEGFTSILLEEGEYTIEVKKKIDEDWENAAKKTIFVGENSIIKLNFLLNKIPSEMKLERMRKKEVQNSNFIPLEKKCTWNYLSITPNNELYACDGGGDNVWIYNKYGKNIKKFKTGEMFGFGIFISNTEMYIGFSGKVDGSWGITPRIINLDGEIIKSFDFIEGASDTGIDVFDNKILFFKSWRAEAWIKDKKSGKHLLKITVPKKYDDANSVFKFHPSGKYIVHVGGKVILHYDYTGKIKKKIFLDAFGYDDKEWRIKRDAQYIDNHTLVLAIENRAGSNTKNIGHYDYIVVDENTNKILYKIKNKINFAVPKKRMDLNYNKSLLAIIDRSNIEIYDIRKKEKIGILNHKIKDKYSTCSSNSDVAFSKTENILMSSCGIWNF